MRVLFTRPRSVQNQPDGFELEADALEALGHEPAWIELEAAIDGRLDGVPAGPTLLRSWMVSESEHRDLALALADGGCELVCDTAAYTAAHYLPRYFDAIEAWAAPTRWIDGTDLDEAWSAAEEIGPPPYLLKDHVKSSAESWDCCYVGAGADRAEFDVVCRRFIEYRGDNFEGGLAIRGMLPLAPLAAESGRPLFDEYRLVFWNGELIAAWPYNDVAGEVRDFARFEILGERIDSPFFTVDVGRLVTGELAIIEVGAGTVSTLPPLADPRALYERILS